MAKTKAPKVEIEPEEAIAPRVEDVKDDDLVAEAQAFVPEVTVDVEEDISPDDVEAEEISLPVAEELPALIVEEAPPAPETGAFIPNPDVERALNNWILNFGSGAGLLTAAEIEAKRKELGG